MSKNIDGLSQFKSAATFVEAETTKATAAVIPEIISPSAPKKPLLQPRHADSSPQKLRLPEANAASRAAYGATVSLFYVSQPSSQNSVQDSQTKQTLTAMSPSNQ